MIKFKIECHSIILLKEKHLKNNHIKMVIIYILYFIFILYILYVTYVINRILSSILPKKIYSIKFYKKVL